ncbi:hypothetical protein C9374_012383 [Naegleria lovaniensis]|uniref:Ankyrin repeat domain-containing protein n=1 Tax=Naegleria lovaniensis TaxID=51637 RepID=A0AA88H0X8_NAELO|nr:uncharacterized protein C9374_012383 [Naegleria lovaniensis]KAG2392131.1 hypothetical protein C9374_012383 [Naegleria lovaniensis]
MPMKEELKESILKQTHSSKSSSTHSVSTIREYREDDEEDHSDLSEISLDLHSTSSLGHSHQPRHVSFQQLGDENEHPSFVHSIKEDPLKVPNYFSPPRLVMADDEETIRPVLSKPQTPSQVHSKENQHSGSKETSSSSTTTNNKTNCKTNCIIEQDVRPKHDESNNITAASPISSSSMLRRDSHSASSPILNSSIMNNPLMSSSFILNSSFINNEEDIGESLTSTMMDEYMTNNKSTNKTKNLLKSSSSEKTTPPPLLSSRSNLFDKLSSFKSNLQSKSSSQDLQELPQVPHEDDEEGFLNDIILSTPNSGSKHHYAHHQHHVHFHGPTIPYLPNSHLPPLVSPISKSNTTNWIELKMKMDDIANSVGSGGSSSNSVATELFLAAQEGDIDLLRTLLESKKVNINAKDKDGFGQTALHYGCWFGNQKVVEYLISRKADINAVNNYNQTPLHEATYRGQLNLVRLLLKNGADKNVTDHVGEKAIDYAKKKKNEATNFTSENVYKEIIKTIESYAADESLPSNQKKSSTSKCCFQ